MPLALVILSFAKPFCAGYYWQICCKHCVVVLGIGQSDSKYPLRVLDIIWTVQIKISSIFCIENHYSLQIKEKISLQFYGKNKVLKHCLLIYQFLRLNLFNTGINFNFFLFIHIILFFICKDLRIFDFFFFTLMPFKSSKLYIL